MYNNNKHCATRITVAMAGKPEHPQAWLASTQAQGYGSCTASATASASGTCSAIAVALPECHCQKVCLGLGFALLAYCLPTVTPTNHPAQGRWPVHPHAGVERAESWRRGRSLRALSGVSGGVLGFVRLLRYVRGLRSCDLVALRCRFPLCESVSVVAPFVCGVLPIASARRLTAKA